MASVTSRIPRLQASTWESLFGLAYLVVGTNAMLTLSCAPLVVLLVTTDPVSSWPVLLLALAAAAPGLTAAFAVFHAYSTRRSTEVIREFTRAWLRHLRRSLAVAALGLTLAVVLVGDLVLVWGSRLGAVVSPVLLVLLVATTTTAVLALVASVERPDARLRDVLRASLYLGVRRWYLSALSLLALASLAGLFTLHPALAVGLAATPLLYLVWGNSRYSLTPVLPVGSAVQV